MTDPDLQLRCSRVCFSRLALQNGLVIMLVTASESRETNFASLWKAGLRSSAVGWLHRLIDREGIVGIVRGAGHSELRLAESVYEKLRHNLKTWDLILVKSPQDRVDSVDCLCVEPAVD